MGVSFSCNIHEKFEDTKGVIRIRKSKDRQHKPIEKEQRDKQWSTNYYTEN
jgi:hypothetical protein